MSRVENSVAMIEEREKEKNDPTTANQVATPDASALRVRRLDRHAARHEQGPDYELHGIPRESEGSGLYRLQRTRSRYFAFSLDFY